MEYYVYILESSVDGSFYVGQTQNVEKRLEIHNKGYGKYTKTRRPWKLIFHVQLTSRSEAIKLERKLKSWKKREAILKFIAEQR